MHSFLCNTYFRAEAESEVNVRIIRHQLLLSNVCTVVGLFVFGGSFGCDQPNVKNRTPIRCHKRTQIGSTGTHCSHFGISEYTFAQTSLPLSNQTGSVTETNYSILGSRNTLLLKPICHLPTKLALLLKPIYFGLLEYTSFCSNQSATFQLNWLCY